MPMELLPVCLWRDRARDNILLMAFAFVLEMLHPLGDGQEKHHYNQGR